MFWCPGKVAAPVHCTVYSAVWLSHENNVCVCVCVCVLFCSTQVAENVRQLATLVDFWLTVGQLSFEWTEFAGLSPSKPSDNGHYLHEKARQSPSWTDILCLKSRSKSKFGQFDRKVDQIRQFNSIVHFTQSNTINLYWFSGYLLHQ